MSIRIRVTAAVAVLATVLSACSFGGQKPVSAGSGSAAVRNAGAAGVQLDATAHGPAPAVPGAHRGGTVTELAWFTFPDGLDPSQQYTTGGLAVLNLITRSLTKYQHRGDKYVLVPDLATDLGTHSPDGLTWTFHLKDGIRFEDGTPVTTADIAYSLKRSFAPELPNGPTYQKQFFLDGQTYKGPYSDGPNYRGVETPDAKTLIIHLAKKFPDLPYFASFPMFGPVPSSHDDLKNPHAYGLHPVATGPYKIAKFTPDQELLLVRNPQWDPDTDPVRNAYPDRFDFKLGVDYQVAEQRMIEDRGVDQTAILDGIDAPTYRTLANGADGLDRLVTGTNPCTDFLYIDTRKVTDPRVRKAIGLAVPYTSAWKLSGKIPGVTIIPGTTLLPPGTPGRIDYDPLGNGAKGDGDPAAAHKLLEQAGALGFTVRFTYVTDVPIATAAMSLYRKRFTAAGFEFRPVPTVADQYQQLSDNPNSDVMIRAGGWCSDWPSGSGWFPPIFYGPLIKHDPKHVPNPSFLDEPEVNAAIERIENMDDLQKAAVEWGKLDKLIMTKYYPAVVFGYELSTFIRGSKIGGLASDATNGFPFYTDLYVK